MITDRRMEYLLLFATRTSKGRSISDAAEEFGVSLPSASSISATLERDGLIRKVGGGVVELTPPAWELVTPKLAQMRRLEEWLEAGVGLLPGHAEREAHRMAACLRDDTVEGIIRYWLCRETGGQSEELNRFFQPLTPGTYLVPFSVYKKDRRELSMGDRGFRKPAQLVREEGGCYFLLYPAEIQRPVGAQEKGRRKTLKGHLERLWYRQDGVWHEAKLSQDGGRAVSCTAVNCTEGPEGLTGTVRIRVRSTLSVIKMPESEADMVFDFSRMKPANRPGLLHNERERI